MPKLDLSTISEIMGVGGGWGGGVQMTPLGLICYDKLLGRPRFNIKSQKSKMQE